MFQNFSLKNISWKQVLNILLILGVLILIGQNLESIPVTLFLWQFSVPLFILITLIFLIGFYTAVGIGANTPRSFSVKDGKVVEEKHEKS